MESPGESLSKTASASFASRWFPRQAWIPRKHSVCAARDSGHFPHRRQRGLAIVLFPERPAHVPVVPIRVERIDAHRLLDPIDSFVDSADKEQRGSTAGEDIRGAAIA